MPLPWNLAPALIGWLGAPDAAVVDSRNYSNLSFSASALWGIDSQWNIGLAPSHSERATATQELYSNAEAQDPSQLVVHAATGVIEVGDAELGQESSQNIDLSLNWTGASAGAWLRVLWAADQDAAGHFETATEGYDAEIRESTSFLRNFAPQAGRSLEAGLRYSF